VPLLVPRALDTYQPTRVSSGVEVLLKGGAPACHCAQVYVRHVSPCQAVYS
jgi:hypothetical protein